MQLINGDPIANPASLLTGAIRLAAGLAHGPKVLIDLDAVAKPAILINEPVVPGPAFVPHRPNVPADGDDIPKALEN